MISIKQSLLSLFSLFAIVVLGLYISTGSSALLRAEDAPAVTNLTGYTWVGNEPLGGASGGDFNLNFVSNGNNYNLFTVSFQTQPFPGQIDNVIYDSTYVYSFEWNDDEYRTILITGGSDVENPLLIAWLEENGTLTPPVTNLTDYTWVGNETIDLGSGSQQVIFDKNINFISNSNSYNEIILRRNFAPPGGVKGYLEYGDLIVYTDNTDYSLGWQDNAYKTIIITGGSDVEDTSLIEWLEENGTLTVIEEDEDTTAPVFDADNPINTTVSYKTTLDLNVWKETLIITDNVDDYVERTIYQDNYTANKAVPGTYVITVRATDTVGNIKDKNYNIIVVDDIKPVFNGPESIYKPQSSSMTIQDILNRYTAFDEISGNVTSRIYVHQDNYTGRGHIANTYTVILRVSDLANNVEYFTIYITVTDDIPPVIYVADGYFIQVSAAYTLTIEGIRDILVATGRLNIVSATTWSVLVNEYQGNENTPGIYTVSIRFQQTSGVTEVHSVAIGVKNASSTPGGIMQPESSNGYIYIVAGVAIIGLIIILKKRK